MTDILYISNGFMIKDINGFKYRVTNIDSNFIILNDYLALTYEEFKKRFDIIKIVIY